MRNTKTYTVSYRRKREGKTDYKKRLKLLLSLKNRLIIRKSLKNITVQIAAYDQKGDEVLISANSNELCKLGWKCSKKNLPAAFLTGFLLGKKAKKAGIKDCVLDLGLQVSVKGSKLYAALKGVVDAGIIVPHSPEVFPSEERIKGAHIKAYAEELKKNKSELFDKIFSAKKADPTAIETHFNDIKTKIAGMEHGKGSK